MHSLNSPFFRDSDIFLSFFLCLFVFFLVCVYASSSGNMIRRGFLIDPSLDDLCCNAISLECFFLDMCFTRIQVAYWLAVKF